MFFLQSLPTASILLSCCHVPFTLVFVSFAQHIRILPFLFFSASFYVLCIDLAFLFVCVFGLSLVPFLSSSFVRFSRATAMCKSRHVGYVILNFM